MILVTGGTGLVGAHLLLKLAKKKLPVVAIYRHKEKLSKIALFFKSVENNQNLFDSITWVQASLNNLTSLEKAFQNVTHVYHCAAKVSFADYDKEKLTLYNREGTANIINLCIKHKIKKIVYVSSIAAIGANTSKNPIDEQNTWNSQINHTPYAYSKYRAELEVWRGTQEGVSAVIVNPGVVLTPHFWQQSSGTLFNRVAKGMSFYPTGSVGIVTVNDVVKTLVLLMESNLINRRYILVSKNLAYKQLFQHIAFSLQKKPPSLPLSKTLLVLLFIVEKVACVFGLRKSFMTISLIDMLCSNNHYDGSKITRDLNFEYEDVLSKITEFGAVHSATMEKSSNYHQ